MVSNDPADHRAPGSLQRHYLPLETAELGQPAKVSIVGGDYTNAKSRCTRRNQCIIRESPTSYLFVAVLCREASKNLAGVAPVSKVWHKNSPNSVKLSLKSFHFTMRTVTRSSIEFLQHNRADPQWQLRIHTSKSQHCGVSPAYGIHVNGSVKQCALH